MTARPALRCCALLFGAVCWIALPASLYAGPGGHGGGGGGGSHGGWGGGGSHGSSSSGGGHSYGGASHSGGSSYSHSGGYASSAPRVGYPGRASSHAAASVNTGSAGYSSLSNFVAVGDADPAHLAANNPALVNMASHGWRFLPSSGISRPDAATRAPSRAVIPQRSMFIPSVHPYRSHPVRPRLPFGYTGFWGSRSGCFFNGFTPVCGANPYFYGAYGPNNCFSAFSYWGCGYGLGYGYGYGLGYGYGDGYAYGPGPGYGYGYGVDDSALPDTDSGAATQPPYDDSGDSNVYMGPILPGSAEAAQPEPSAPRTPPTRIILKNGSAYEVTAYWVSDGQLYYRPVTGGLNHVPLEQLNLSATVEANSRNGLTFTLTDRPPQP